MAEENKGEKGLEELTEIEKLMALASSASIDPQKLIAELVAKVEIGLTPKMVSVLGNTLGDYERRLAEMVKPMIEGAVTAKLPGIVNEVGTQLIEKYRGTVASAGDNKAGEEAGVGPVGGMGGLVNSVLANPNALNAIANLVAAFKGTGGLGQSSQFNNLMNGVSIGLKLKQTPEAFDDIRKQINEGLNPPKPQ